MSDEPTGNNPRLHLPDGLTTEEIEFFHNEITSLRTQLTESKEKREAAFKEYMRHTKALVERAEAAEADYAALREKIQQCKGFHHYNNEGEAIVNRSDWLTLMEIFDDPHPGVELLARMKRMEEALERAYDALCIFDAQEAEGNGGDFELLEKAQNILGEARAALPEKGEG